MSLGLLGTRLWDDMLRYTRQQALLFCAARCSQPGQSAFPQTAVLEAWSLGFEDQACLLGPALWKAAWTQKLEFYSISQDIQGSHKGHLRCCMICTNERADGLDWFLF